MKKGRLTPTLFRYVENLLILALLIGNSAGSLEGLDMLHWYLLLNRLVQQLYHSFSLDASPAVPLVEN